MDSETFRKQGYAFVDWMADYMDQVETYPVKSQVPPRSIYNQIPQTMPTKGEDMGSIFEDFKNKILPGITHWQHPNFHAYFPANTSPPSILAEMLMSTLGIQGMKWDTSPAATELEEKMMEWLKIAIGVPEDWSGVIQDTATNATLTAILTAREQRSKYQINKQGFEGFTNFRVYCSSECHSSIEKGAKIAGIGKENVIKVPTDKDLAMQSRALAKHIQEDIKNGYQPLCIVAAIGTTGTTAIDPLKEIGKIANKHNIWLHVDAAYAGSALLLPELRWMISGIEQAHSFVFNPHKWLFTNFDCTAYFVKDKDALINTFTILPEYLKTKTDGIVNNYCDWGIPLGRRFRSLKLWFVMRYYGLSGLQDKLRNHLILATWFETKVVETENFRLMTPRTLNLICFQYNPPDISDMDTLNALNERLLQQLNASGQLYLTHTKVHGAFTLRMVIGQTNVTGTHVEKAWSLIRNYAEKLIV